MDQEAKRVEFVSDTDQGPKNQLEECAEPLDRRQWVGPVGEAGGPEESRQTVGRIPALCAREDGSR